MLHPSNIIVNVTQKKTDCILVEYKIFCLLFDKFTTCILIEKYKSIKKRPHHYSDPVPHSSNHHSAWAVTYLQVMFVLM